MLTTIRGDHLDDKTVSTLVLGDLNEKTRMSHPGVEQFRYLVRLLNQLLNRKNPNLGNLTTRKAEPSVILISYL